MGDRPEQGPEDRAERIITLISKAAQAATLVGTAIDAFLRIHW